MCMPSTIPILHSWDLGLTHRDKVVVTPICTSSCNQGHSLCQTVQKTACDHDAKLW